MRGRKSVESIEESNWRGFWWSCCTSETFSCFQFKGNVNLGDQFQGLTKSKNLTVYVDDHCSCCRFPNAIWRRARVGTSLGSVRILNGQPLARWICNVAEFTIVWPRDNRRRSSVSNTFKMHIITFSNIVSLWRLNDRGRIYRLERKQKTTLRKITALK